MVMDKSAPEYQSWQAMRQRCGNPNTRLYHRYGGRGIKVCDRWQHSFEAFQADMGPRPDGSSIDRIDNDGDYTPENCRWATRGHQNRNRSDTRFLTHKGETLCVMEWSERTGLPYPTIMYRLKSGYSVADTLDTPRGGFRFHMGDNHRVLTADQVREIRSRYIPRDPRHGTRAMAREFGVSPDSIGQIIRGEKWRHVE